MTEHTKELAGEVKFIQNTQESGPTNVGDEFSDQELMCFLGATLKKNLCNNFCEYQTADCPRVVLNKLATRGYRVVGVAGTGQTWGWTLYKEDS